MWGRFFGIVARPTAILLVLIAIAFGTSPLFAVIIAAVIGAIMLIVYGIGQGRARVSKPGEPGGPGRPSGAPVSGEGSGSPQSATGRSPT